MKKVKKIVIIGTSGCGKTSLGKRLSKMLELPSIDLDDMFWLPGWIERDKKEIEERICEKANSDEWIISGNYSRLSNLIWPKADMIVWLDYPFYKIFWRCLKRTCRRIITREKCCNGNTESVKMLFSSKSILLWVLRTYRKRKRAYSKFFQDPKNNYIQRVHICNSMDEKNFLNDFQT